MRTRLKRLSHYQQLGSAQNRSLVVDQGTDRGGENLGFRPTELWMLGLSACSMTTMTRYAKEQNIPLSGVEIAAEDELGEDGHIVGVTFLVKFEGELSSSQKSELLDYVSKNCKLLRTIHPDIRLVYSEASEEPAVNPSCTLEGGNCCL